MWKNEERWPTLTRDQIRPLIENKQIKTVSLYEPDHAHWREFLWADFGKPIGKRPYRWMPGCGTRK